MQLGIPRNRVICKIQRNEKPPHSRTEEKGSLCKSIDIHYPVPHPSQHSAMRAKGQRSRHRGQTWPCSEAKSRFAELPIHYVMPTQPGIEDSPRRHMRWTYDCRRGPLLVSITIRSLGRFLNASTCIAPKRWQKKNKKIREHFPFCWQKPSKLGPMKERVAAIWIT